MGKIIKDSSGKVLLAGGGAFEVTATVDNNIVAENIKKDVTILGVTGTYEGSGGGGGGTTSVSVTLDAGGLLYYVTSEGTVTSYDVPGTGTLSCLSGSVLVYFANSGATFTNCTLIQSVTMGTRANYNPVYIYQVA